MKNQEFKTTCSYCGVGCGMIVEKDLSGKIDLRGDESHPVNKGMLCSKGRNLHYTVRDTSDRLMKPAMRLSRSHPMVATDWDTALTRAAKVFSAIIKEHGPDSVGFYVSGQCLTEEYYLVNKLVKGFLGTNNLDTNSRLCMSSAVVGYMKTVGEDSVPISYDDIELSDCFMIAGANPAWCHPILFRRLEAHKVANPDVKVIVVDPRKTATCSVADLHLQITPGTDVVLYNAIARSIFDTKLEDTDFINNHTESIDSYKKLVMKTSLSKAATICGVQVHDIKLAAQYIGNAKAYIAMWAMGLNQSVIGVDKNFSLLNISLMTGNIGKPGAGPFSLTGQPNAMGGREVGGMSSLLAAHREQSNPNHRKDVADFWDVAKLPDKPGLTATQMFDALRSGKMKAVWIICTNPLVSLPDLHKMEDALDKARFVVVQDISHSSDTTKYADLLLPAAGWLEKEGTMTNSDRRISHLSKVIEPRGEALPDAEILWRFAQKMGFSGFDYGSVSEVYDEHCRLTKGTNIDISGLNYRRLQEEGTFQWPVPYDDHPGTPRLFADKVFYTISGKASFNTPSQMLGEGEQPSVALPLILTTGRLRDQWHTMTKTGKVNKLKTHIPIPVLEIHPLDAQFRSLKDGDVAEIYNGRGEVRVQVKVTDSIKLGVVFLPMHWGKILNKTFARANNLTENVYDPKSKQPNFKYSIVEVRKHTKAPQKILVIGAGSAAYRFIQTYRDVDKDDTIEVFSSEAYPFYNRVLLPEYISEHLEWSDLMKLKEGELKKLNVTLYGSTSIASIDRDKKTVQDALGNEHTYDLLVVATGSRPFVPRDVPRGLSGFFTMRTREDADRLKVYLDNTGLPQSEQHIVIVGGGLLGLELAAAMRARDVKITIIQRGSRLMERQLDPLASRLLVEEVKERGINVYFENEVDTIFEQEGGKRMSISLKSGKIISCNATVYTIGTRPNIELLKKVDIECGRGVVVNDHLQTSDPSIFALGEIAEFKKNIYGITAAAEQQADVAARFIAGDYSSMYHGSVLLNILKFSDFNLCSIGQVSIPQNDPNYEEVTFTDYRQRYYKKCLIHQDRLIGAILIGDKAEFAEFKMLIEGKIELSEKRSELLRGQSDKVPVKGKLVCSCNEIGMGNIEDAIKDGCNSFSELCQVTGAGIGCGSCKPEVKDIFEQAKATV